MGESNIRKGYKGSFDDASDDIKHASMMSPLAVGLRQYNGPDDVRENFAKEVAEKNAQQQGKTKEYKDGFSLSANDEKYIKNLSRQKAYDIKDISPKHQRRIRSIINDERKVSNLPEIQYPEINPMYDSYNKKYAQLIIDRYNSSIDHIIQSFHDEKLYEYELQKLKHCTKNQLQKRIKNIPQDVRTEIIQSLQMHPQSIAAYKKDVQQKIVAAFNVYY